MLRKIICKITRKHKLKGPFPVGHHGEVRYMCSRCRQVVVFSGGLVTFVEDDPYEHVLWDLVD